MFCHYCGNQLPDYAVFCNQCGKKVPTVDSPPSQPQLPPWQPPGASQTAWTIPMGPPPQPWQPPSTVSPTQWSMPVGSPSQPWPGPYASQPQWTSLVPPGPPWQPVAGSQPPWAVSQAAPPLSRMQRLLIRIFQPALAGNAVLGIVLGGILVAILGALVSALLLAIAHALGQHAAQGGTSSENLIDFVLGIWPLHSSFRESMQLFLVIHGIATHVQSVSGGTDFSSATFIEPLHGLLVIPALLLTLGGYFAASTDLQNRTLKSLLRGAAIAIPYTILLLIMSTQVNGSVQIPSAGSSEVDRLSVDIPTLIVFGLLWGILFGLLGASLKLARGRWRHLGFRYLRTNPRPLLSGMVTGGLAAVGLAISLSLLVVFCLLAYNASALPSSSSNFGFSFGALSGSLSGWQALLISDIAWGPLKAINLFIFASGAPIKVSCSVPVLTGNVSNPCLSSNSTLPSFSLFGGTTHFSPWIYLLLALPTICLFLGGRISAATGRAQGVGPGAFQGVLIAVPFTLLMILLMFISTFTFGLTSATRGNIASFTVTAGASAFDLVLWALLSSAIFGALGGIYQVSPLKTSVSRFLSLLAMPLKLLCKPVYFVFDRLSGMQRSSQRSHARNFVYGAFVCALLLAIIAGAVGGLLIAYNQTFSLDANRLIKNIVYVSLIALPGLLLISACASALSRDPSESQSKLVLLFVPVLVIALVAGSLTWLQWSSQRGIELGYPAPQVHITPLSSGTALINENVQFSADATGRDITFDWDFGDGSHASGPIVSHPYRQLSGQQSNYSYTVTVNITDPLGRTSSDTTTIRILPPLPNASFGYTEETDFSGVYNQVIDFNADSSIAGTGASIANYIWDFGDGSNDSNGSSHETHYYGNTGAYNITLVVVDSVGQQSSIYQMTVQVQ